MLLQILLSKYIQSQSDLINWFIAIFYILMSVLKVQNPYAIYPIEWQLLGSK